MGIKKISKTETVITPDIKIGYVAYDFKSVGYLNTDGYLVELDENDSKLVVKDTMEEILDEINDLDCPEDWDVHKIQISYDILEVYKRKVNYEKQEMINTERLSEVIK